ncbi:MAG: hypothetical protein NZ531_02860, partial [Aquificaceae bacterium]|nr:hypothetical protein [Aquificaceae bacterium]
PELAKALAEPLSRTERIILIGDGHGAGISRFTGDMAQALAQLPVVIEALTGVRLSSVLARTPVTSSPEEVAD